ncbi:AraC family transcriptional regulator [Marinomonas sp. THO17]|uniref:AraC family transcriptional regulator n=1 Tax=Marinomonas sp. THO17 TaxID=3149048 RepID=UPI00336BEBA9
MLQEFHELESRCHTAMAANRWMDNICGPHELDLWGKESLDFHHKGHRLPGLDIVTGLLSYGSGVAINVNADDKLKGYSLSLPITGKQTLRCIGSELKSDHEQGLIVSPTHQQELEISPDCQKLQLLIPSHSVHYVAEKLTGDTIKEPIQFDATMQLRQREIKAWWCMVQQIANHWSTMSALYSHPKMVEDLEFTIIKGLLLSQPNTLTSQLQESTPEHSRPATPAYLIRACEWMKNHARDKVTIEDICDYAGVSRFTLFSGFKEYFGDSPLGWLKKYRMTQVRHALMNSNSRTKVSSMAMEWGFNHFGRFSQEYQLFFGELPSQTLSQNKEV